MIETYGPEGTGMTQGAAPEIAPRSGHRIGHASLSAHGVKAGDLEAWARFPVPPSRSGPAQAGSRSTSGAESVSPVLIGDLIDRLQSGRALLEELQLARELCDETLEPADDDGTSVQRRELRVLSLAQDADQLAKLYSSLVECLTSLSQLRPQVKALAQSTRTQDVEAVRQLGRLQHQVLTLEEMADRAEKGIPRLQRPYCTLGDLRGKLPGAADMPIPEWPRATDAGLKTAMALHPDLRDEVSRMARELKPSMQQAQLDIEIALKIEGSRAQDLFGQIDLMALDRSGHNALLSAVRACDGPGNPAAACYAEALRACIGDNGVLVGGATTLIRQAIDHICNWPPSNGRDQIRDALRACLAADAPLSFTTAQPGGATSGWTWDRAGLALRLDQFEIRDHFRVFIGNERHTPEFLLGLTTDLAEVDVTHRSAAFNALTASFASLPESSLNDVQRHSFLLRLWSASASLALENNPLSIGRRHLAEVSSYILYEGTLLPPVYRFQLTRKVTEDAVQHPVALGDLAVELLKKSIQGDWGQDPVTGETLKQAVLIDTAFFVEQLDKARFGMELAMQPLRAKAVASVHTQAYDFLKDAMLSMPAGERQDVFNRAVHKATQAQANNMGDVVSDTHGENVVRRITSLMTPLLDGAGPGAPERKSAEWRERLASWFGRRAA